MKKEKGKLSKDSNEEQLGEKQDYILEQLSEIQEDSEEEHNTTQVLSRPENCTCCKEGHITSEDVRTKLLLH